MALGGMCTVRTPAPDFGGPMMTAPLRLSPKERSTRTVPTVSVHVVPSQSEYLAPAQGAPRRQDDGRLQLGRHRLQQGLDLGHGRDRALLRTVGTGSSDAAGVAGNEVVGHCRVEDCS